MIDLLVVPGAPLLGMTVSITNNNNKYNNNDNMNINNKNSSDNICIMIVSLYDHYYCYYDYG